MLRLFAVILVYAIITGQGYPEASAQDREEFCCILDAEDDGPLTLACKRSGLVGENAWRIDGCSRSSGWTIPDDSQSYVCPSGTDAARLQWCSKPPSCCIAEDQRPWDGPVILFCAGRNTIQCSPWDIHEGRCPVDPRRLPEC